MIRVCFIANGYPFREESEYSFVKNLIDEIANNDVECTIISPQSISHKLLNKCKLRPKFWSYKNKKGNTIKVYQPYYISFSNLKIKGNSVSNILFMKAAKKVYKMLKSQDIIYGHFWQCGIIGTYLADNRVPVVVATGESKIDVRSIFDKQIIENALKKIKGVICVSTKNKEESINLDLIKNHMKVEIFPNGINPDKFYLIDKNKARERLGFNTNSTIGVYVGAFTHRKGIQRVEKAINDIQNLKMIYIGKGPCHPKNYLFCGSLENEKIVYYLNAADFFILPTLAEGCCNAIIEAMACGLPIISSDLNFNYDILNKESSILVNPNNIKEINEAVQKIITNNELSERLHMSSLKKSKELTIGERAKKIVLLFDKILKC